MAANAKERPKGAKLETIPAVRRPEPLPPLKNLLAVAAGGAIGTTMRYSLLLLFPSEVGRFPLTVFLENLAGAFLLGLVLTLLLERWRPGWDLRPFLATGIFGSFTTFSNVSVDIVRLSETMPALALFYAGASILAGLAAAFLGVASARALSK